MRGDVFDGRGFLKTAISGKETDPKSKTKNIDFDVDVKLGAVAGFFGEALRSVDAKMSRRNGAIKSFTFTSKLGRDTPVTADLRGRAQGREVIYLETNDAGALLRFTDTYSKVVGGQLQLAMDPPTAEPSARKKDCSTCEISPSRARHRSIVWRRAVRRVGKAGIGFSRLRAEFIRQNGQLTIREGVLKGARSVARSKAVSTIPATRCA